MNIVEQYCKEHRIKVDKINKSRHKNCINKEKIIKILKIELNYTKLKETYLIEYFNEFIKDLENGEFDNE